MLEGASPLSDRSASSRKSEEVITDEPHAGKLARVVLAVNILFTFFIEAVSNNLASARRWRTSPNYWPFILESFF